MGLLGELLAVDQQRALEFFAVGLRDVSEPPVDAQELLYNASILAHYTLVSTQSVSEIPAPAGLHTVFEHFVVPGNVPPDGIILESAGAQCLLMAGFFEDQMRTRHNLGWYAALGAGFFSRAASWQHSPAKARLLETLAGHFELWRRRQGRLGRELREQAHLLVTPAPSRVV